MDTMEGLWQRIEDWMHRHAPESWQQLAPGATEEAIKRMEHILAITLPDDFRASYCRHNGGYEVELVTSMKVLPVEDMIYHWQILTELLDDEDWASMPPYYFKDDGLGWETGPIQPVWWHPQWIPFGMDNAGNHSCLDMAPAPGGPIGQVIDWDHESGPSRVLFPSFHQLLRAFAEQLGALQMNKLPESSKVTESLTALRYF
jgi:cell wall assembly regulator SMI1